MTNGQISPLGTFRRYVGGSLVELVGEKGAAPPGPAHYRAPITRFTRRARIGVLKSHAKIDRRGMDLPLFWTGTYPRQYSVDPHRWHRDMDTLGKRLRRRYPRIAIQWRLEAQKRGAPHFHALIHNVPWIHKKKMARLWYEVVGSGDRRHLRRGSRIEKVKSWRGVQHYVNKYLAKEPGDEGHHEFPPGTRPGRFWGIIGRANLPRTVVEVEVEGADMHILRRIMAGLQRARRRQRAKRLGSGAAGRPARRYRPRRWDGIWTFTGEDTAGKLEVWARGPDRPLAA